MRGRLIFPMVIEIAQLDTTATEAVDSGTGYDDVFREPNKQSDTVGDQTLTADEQTGDSPRQETLIRIQAQIEPTTMDTLRQMQAGDTPDAEIVCVAHWQELEDLGYVDANGEPTIRKNDRLNAIYTCEEELIQTIRTPPGLYVVDVTSIGFGFGTTRNLLRITFQERELSVPA